MLFFLKFGLLKFFADFTKGLVEFIKAGAFKLIGVGLGKVGMLDREQKAVQILVGFGNIPQQRKNLINKEAITERSVTIVLSKTPPLSKMYGWAAMLISKAPTS